MKKTIFAILTLVALPVIAQQNQNKTTNVNGFYAGVGAGYSNLNVWKDPTLTYLSSDFKDIGYKVFGGYSYTENFAVEFGYTSLGKGKSTIDDTPDVKATSKPSAYHLSAKLTPTFDFALKPFLKVGVARLTNKESYDNGDPSDKVSKTTAIYGLGVQMPISQSLLLRAEYESYGKVGSTDSNGNDPARVKPTLFSLSIVSSF